MAGSSVGARAIGSARLAHSRGCRGLGWVWRALDRHRSRWRFLWPAPFVYSVVTGGSPYTVLMLVILITWLSIKSLVETKSWMSVLPMLGGAALGFGMSAPACLAILDYVHRSPLALYATAAHCHCVVPWLPLPGFDFPC